MGLAELTQTKGWKNFMSKLYGIGAAIVIVGALFKIQHWPGAGPALIAGLTIEALIFLFSAFEPLHEELDWTLAYPELAGLSEEDEIEIDKPKKKVQSDGSGLAMFDEMISKAGGAALFTKLGDNLNNLSKKAGDIADISQATLATKEYSDSMKSASTSINKFSSSYQESANALSAAATKSAETLSYSVDGLADSYQKASSNVMKANDDLVGTYKRLSESMDVKVDFSSVTAGNNSYNEQITKLNKNLSALNAIFELQLEGGLEEMMEDLSGAVTEGKKYKDEVARLSKRIGALNTVYGNMLSAMNVKVD